MTAATDQELAALADHLVAMEESWGSGEAYLVSAEHDLAFHRGLLALAGNERMAVIYDQMLAQTLLLLRTTAEGNPTLRRGMRRSAHRDMLAALAARDEAKARAAIEAHYRYAEDRLFAGFATHRAARGS